MTPIEFYTEYYKKMKEDTEKACECINRNSSSKLREEINEIKEMISKLTIRENWQDQLGESFAAVMESCSEALGGVIGSIDTSFKASEEDYKLLNSLLDEFKELDEKYRAEIRLEPHLYTEVYKRDSERLDERGEPISYYDRGAFEVDHDKWEEKVHHLQINCETSKASIDQAKSLLDSINKITIDFQGGKFGAGTSLSKQYENLVNLLSENNSSIEARLEQISEDPKECVRIVDLRGFANTKVHTFMGWQCVTDSNSDQYILRQAVCPDFNKTGENTATTWHDSDGFAKIGDRYVVATTTLYGQVGDYIDIEQADGSVIHAIIGDIKRVTPKENSIPRGHQNGECVVEFIVDCGSGWYKDDAKTNWRNLWGSFVGTNKLVADVHPEWNQNIAEIRNLGNYEDFAEEFGYAKAGLNHYQDDLISLDKLY